MICSNGICGITEIEAKIGDILCKSFPCDITDRESYIEAKLKLNSWVIKNKIEQLSFWDYTPTKKIRPDAILAPSPFHHPIEQNSKAYLDFPFDLAMIVLHFDYVPTYENN